MISNQRHVFFVLRPTLVFCRIWIFSEDAKLEQVFCVACIQPYNILVHEQKYRYIIAYIHVCFICPASTVGASTRQGLSVYYMALQSPYDHQ